MTNILFLDFDGVLNSHSGSLYLFEIGRGGGITHLDPTLLEFLNETVVRSNCKIVVSSTWRKTLSVKELRKCLVDDGFKYPEMVIDKTKVIGDRDIEILEWLKNTELDVETFVVVDDEISDLRKVEENLVKTNILWGLTRENVNDIVGRFGGRKVN